METDKDDSAFPIVTNSESCLYDAYGLTKREYFSAIALQGLLSNPSIDFVEPEQLAHDAILYAAALIKELNK